ncbi:MAG: hypothetical protein ACPGRW_06070 [Flavobacteriaceae bacterium]
MRLKPDLTMYFAQMPLIGMWLKADYEKAETLEDMTALCHKWNNEAERTTNPIRKTHFQASANFIYTLITGQSYESKNLIKQ